MDPIITNCDDTGCHRISVAEYNSLPKVVNIIHPPSLKPLTNFDGCSQKGQVISCGNCAADPIACRVFFSANSAEERSSLDKRMMLAARGRPRNLFEVEVTGEETFFDWDMQLTTVIHKGFKFSTSKTHGIKHSVSVSANLESQLTEA